MSLFKEDLLDRAEAQLAPPQAALTVLIVDDEVGNLRVMRTLFGQTYRVLEATDGAEALALLQGLTPAEQPAVILSDQRMPHMTGVELFERLRVTMPDTIRIIITGFVDVGAIVDSINRAGIYKFVVKPFDHDELRITVERAIEAWQMRREIQLHVEQLESKVRERTRELEASNTALRNANFEIERASLTDPLTGLANRRCVVSRLQSVATGSTSTADGRHGLLLIDIDLFKSVNDNYGHAAGDAVLRGIAAILREQCGEDELAVRWGGEEFLLHVRADDEADALARAESVRAAVEAADFDIGEGQSLRRSCSIGVACWPFDLLEPARLGWEQVLQVADGALYMAKRGGRNQVNCLAANGRLPQGAEHLLSQELPGLVASGAFVVHGRRGG